VLERKRKKNRRQSIRCKAEKRERESERERDFSRFAPSAPSTYVKTLAHSFFLQHKRK